MLERENLEVMTPIYPDQRAAFPVPIAAFSLTWSSLALSDGEIRAQDIARRPEGTGANQPRRFPGGQNEAIYERQAGAALRCLFFVRLNMLPNAWLNTNCTQSAKLEERRLIMLKDHVITLQKVCSPPIAWVRRSCSTHSPSFSYALPTTGLQHWRGYTERKKYRKARKAAVLIQSTVRMAAAR